MHNKNMPALLGALAFCVAAPASAGLYRCGNVFQDRPCDVATQEPIRPGHAVAPAAQRAASAASAPASAQAQAAHEPASAPARDNAATVRAASAASTSTAGTAPARKGPPSLACGNLREQQIAIEARLRAGGRHETIEMYTRQQRDVEKNLQDGNCL